MIGARALLSVFAGAVLMVAVAAAAATAQQPVIIDDDDAAAGPVVAVVRAHCAWRAPSRRGVSLVSASVIATGDPGSADVEGWALDCREAAAIALEQAGEACLDRSLALYNARIEPVATMQCPLDERRRRVVGLR